MVIVDHSLDKIIDSGAIVALELRRLTGVVTDDGVVDPYLLVACEHGDYETWLYAGTYDDVLTESAHLIRALYRDPPVYLLEMPGMLGHGVREHLVCRYVVKQ